MPIGLIKQETGFDKENLIRPTLNEKKVMSHCLKKEGKENFRSKRFYPLFLRTRCRYHDDDDDDDENEARLARVPEGWEQTSVSQSNQIQFSANGNF